MADEYERVLQEMQEAASSHNISDWFENAPKMTRNERDLYTLTGKLPDQYLRRLEIAGFSVNRQIGGWQVSKDGHRHFSADQTPRPLNQAFPNLMHFTNKHVEEEHRWSNAVYQKIIARQKELHASGKGYGTWDNTTIAKADRSKYTEAQRRQKAIRDIISRRATTSSTPEGSTHQPKYPAYQLHKKQVIEGTRGQNPTIGEILTAKQQAIRDFQQRRDKYEGLEGIVKEATQSTAISSSDLGMEIDKNTRKIVGGVSSYVEEVLPANDDIPDVVNTGIVKTGKRKYKFNSDGTWSRVAGPPTKAEQAAINKASFTQGEMTPYSPISGDITGHYGAIRQQQGLYGEQRKKWNDLETQLAQRAAYKQWQKTVSAFSASSTSLAESAASIAFNGRFRLANYLGKYENVDERREYLHDAGIDPDAAHGRSILKLAQREYDRRNNIPDTSNWKLYGRGAEAQWNPRSNPNMRPGDVAFNDGYRNKWSGKNPNPWWQNQYTKDNPLGFNWEGRAWYGPTKIQGNNPGNWLGVQGKDIKSYRARMYGDPTNASYSGLGSDNMYLQDPGPWRGVADTSFWDRSKNRGIIGHNLDYIDKSPVTVNVGAISKSGLMTGLSLASKGLQVFGAAAEQVGQTLRSVWKAEKKQAAGIYEAGSYFIPGPFKEAGNRFFKAGLQAADSVKTKKYGAWEGGGQIASGLGGIVGGIVTGNAAGVAGGVQNIGKGIGTIWTSRVQSQGLDIQSRINMWAGFSELLLAPIRLVGNAARWLWNNFQKLGASILGVVSQFNQLGLPLTMLTGVHYSNMQRSYVADAMIGRNKGTTNSTYESFSGAQQDLYTFGKLDEHRLISSAMLGVFNDVYAYGGNTQAQYGNMVNTIYRQLQNASPSGQQRIMNLARGIDDTLPARLQQMKNLGISDYRRIQDGSLIKEWKINQYTATDTQRARYTKAGMEVTALRESMSETGNVIAERLWRAIGKPAMSALNDIFYSLANGGSWRDTVSKVKKAAKELWANISEEFGLNPDFKGFLAGVGDHLKTLIWSIVPHVASVVSETVKIIGRGYAGLIETTQPLVNRFLTELSTTRIDVGLDSHGLTFNVSTNKSRQRDFLEDQAAKGYHDAMSWAAEPVNALSLYGGGKMWNGVTGRGGDELRRRENEYYKAVYGIDGTPLADEFDQKLRGENFDSWEEAKTWYAKKFTEKYLAGFHSAGRLMDMDDLEDISEAARKDPKARGRLMYSVDPEGWDAKDTGIWTQADAHSVAENFIEATDQLASTIKNAFPDLAEALLKIGDGLKLAIDVRKDGKEAAKADVTTKGVVAVKAVDLQSVQVVGNTLRILEGGIGQ